MQPRLGTIIFNISKINFDMILGNCMKIKGGNYFYFDARDQRDSDVKNRHSIILCCVVNCIYIKTKIHFVFKF